MKIKLLTFFAGITLCLCNCSVFAQPVLTNYFLYNVGDSYSYQKISNLGVIPASITITGSNVTWDFSNLLLEDTVRTDTIISYANSMFPTSFNGCTHVFEEHTGLQQFWKISGDTLFYMGNSSSGQENHLTPDVINFISPTSFGTIYPTTTTTVSVGAWTQSWDFNYQYTAYGTLILPNDTIQNVALFYGTAGPTDNSVTYHDYSFVLANDVSPLLRIQTYQVGTGTPTPIIGYMSTAVQTLSLDEIELNNKVSIYPNPAKDWVQINTEIEFSEYEITNSMGQIVQSGKTKSNRLNVEELNPGLFWIRLFTPDGKVATKKLLIQ